MADESSGRASAFRLAGTAVIGALALAQLASSYLRERALATGFGATRALDMYLIALSLPQAIGLEAANAAVSLLLPRYAGALTSTNGPPLRLFWRDLRAWSAWLGGVALLIGAAASGVAALLGRGLTDAQREVVARDIRLLAILVVLLGLSGVARAWLDAQRRVWISAAMPMLRPLAIAVLVFGALHGGGPTVATVVMAALLGAALALAIQLLSVYHYSSHREAPAAYAPNVSRAAFQNLGILALTALLNQSGDFIDKSLGSTTGSGQVAALSYATMILSIPTTVLVGAFAAVALPEFARARHHGSSGEVRTVLRRHARPLVLAMVPVVAVLVLTPRTLVALLLGSRNLGPTGTEITAACVSALALGQIFYAASVMLRQQLLAHERYGIILVTSASSLVVKLLASLLMIPSFGVVGLALGTTAGTTVAFAMFLSSTARLKIF